MESQKKLCFKCYCYRDIELFGEYRTCSRCREYCKKRYETHRDLVVEQQKKYYQNNRDSIREQQKEYLKEYRQITIRCDVCDRDIKKCKKAEHERTKKHLLNLGK